MTTFTMRYIKGHFIVTGPDVAPTKCKSRAEARDWCKEHSPARLFTRWEGAREGQLDRRRRRPRPNPPTAIDPQVEHQPAEHSAVPHWGFLPIISRVAKMARRLNVPAGTLESLGR